MRPFVVLFNVYILLCPIVSTVTYKNIVYIKYTAICVTMHF